MSTCNNKRLTSLGAKNLVDWLSMVSALKAITMQFAGLCYFFLPLPRINMLLVTPEPAEMLAFSRPHQKANCPHPDIDLHWHCSTPSVALLRRSNTT